MIGWWATAALAASPGIPGWVILDVGVAQVAGSTADLAADGADGQCTVELTRLSCPASGPVTFRWGPGGPWALVGDTVLDAGSRGQGWVLASEEAVAEARADLDLGVSEERVRQWFVRTGAHAVPFPSRSMLDWLFALPGVPDPLVKLAFLDAVVPWFRHTASDPFPPTAPELVPAGLLLGLAKDPDPRVRRRTAYIVREVGFGDRSAEVAEVLHHLLFDPDKSVRIIALQTDPFAARHEAVGLEEAWVRAMERLPRPRAEGRTAAVSLSLLAADLDPSDVVDPVAAVALCIEHHPDAAWRLWTAWRQHVPYREDWALLLLSRTTEVGGGLLMHWAKTSPEALAATLRRWEPGPPHGQRFGTVAAHLERAKDPGVRAALGLPPLSVDKVSAPGRRPPKR